MHPLRAGWLALIFGLLLSSVLTYLVSVILRRRVLLEKLVKERTTKLIEINKHFNELAQQSRTVTWEIDAAGLYTYVSDVAIQVYGYKPEDIIGKMHFYDLHPEKGREEFKAAAFDIFARKESINNLVNPIQTKNGDLIWVSTNGMPMRISSACMSPTVTCSAAVWTIRTISETFPAFMP